MREVLRLLLYQWFTRSSNYYSFRISLRSTDFLAVSNREKLLVGMLLSWKHMGSLPLASLNIIVIGFDSAHFKWPMDLWVSMRVCDFR